MQILIVEGFTLQASLILGLGAQNLFLLDCGIKKKNYILVATICSICDFILIFLGVAGAGTLFANHPYFKLFFTVLGVGFLFYYGFKKLFEKIEPNTALPQKPSTRRQIYWKTLGFSLLNPHVYLDTLVLLGGYSSKYEKLNQRLSFGLGAALYSILWFYSLGIFASSLNRFITKAIFFRVINIVAGLILIFLGIKLIIDLTGS
jgi:L-lysine exporter family protein LysE/ArgO